MLVTEFRVLWEKSIKLQTSTLRPQGRTVSLKHDGTDGSVNTDGAAIERVDGTANTGVN